MIQQKFVLYHYDKKNMNKVEDMHSVIRFLQKLRGSVHEKLSGGGGGGHFRNLWVGMCRWDPGTIDLYQS